MAATTTEIDINLKAQYEALLKRAAELDEQEKKIRAEVERQEKARREWEKAIPAHIETLRKRKLSVMDDLEKQTNKLSKLDIILSSLSASSASASSASAEINLEVGMSIELMTQYNKYKNAKNTNDALKEKIEEGRRKILVAIRKKQQIKQEADAQAHQYQTMSQTLLGRLNP